MVLTAIGMSRVRIGKRQYTAMQGKIVELERENAELKRETAELRGRDISCETAELRGRVAVLSDELRRAHDELRKVREESLVARLGVDAVSTDAKRAKVTAEEGVWYRKKACVVCSTQHFRLERDMYKRYVFWNREKYGEATLAYTNIRVKCNWSETRGDSVYGSLCVEEDVNLTSVLRKSFWLPRGLLRADAVDVDALDVDFAVGPVLDSPEFEKTEHVSGGWDLLRTRAGRSVRKTDNGEEKHVYMFRPPKIEVNEKYYVWGEIPCMVTDLKDDRAYVHYHWKVPNVVDCDFVVHYSTLRKKVRCRK